MSKIIIAVGPVIIENNQVLLNKDKKDNFWKFCGGRVEDGEINIKETLKREVKEEMGLDLEILDEPPYFFYTEKESADGLVSVILIHFLARRIGEIVPGPETTDWSWINLDNLDQIDLAPNIKPTLRYFGF